MPDQPDTRVTVAADRHDGQSVAPALTLLGVIVVWYIGVAAMVLGIVMGTMVEQAFVTSLIKSDGSILPFFDRPISAILATMAIGAFVWPVLVWLWRRLKPAAAAAATSSR